MRISDWSSDVCSSDLEDCCAQAVKAALAASSATQAGSTRRKSMIASSALGPRGPVDVHDAPALRHLLEHHRLCTEQHQRFAVLLGMQFALAADPGEVAGGARATAHQLTVRILQELGVARSEEHTSELQSLMRISYAVFCLNKKNNYMPQR